MSVPVREVNVYRGDGGGCSFNNELPHTPMRREPTQYAPSSVAHQQLFLELRRHAVDRQLPVVPATHVN